jgi:hypothetical protein
MDTKTDLEQRRKKNFKAEIKPDAFDKELYLSITHNGYQWSSVALNHDEMAIVIEVLRKELRE